jgi:hypothetical protein
MDVGSTGSLIRTVDCVHKELRWYYQISLFKYDPRDDFEGFSGFQLAQAIWSHATPACGE